MTDESDDSGSDGAGQRDGAEGKDGAEQTDGAEAGASDAEAPLSDLARHVSDRRRGREPTDSASRRSGDAEQATERGGASGGSDDPFRQMSVAEIDEEVLWSSLEGGEEPTVTVGPAEPAGAGDLADEEATATANANETVVPKGEYCQKCPYLHDPPELACTHEGTEIVAVEDADHFRVRDCPMVEK